MSHPVVSLSRSFHVSAAHRLRSPKLTEVENQAVFGKCNRLHGHNYTIKIIVKGEVCKSHVLWYQQPTEYAYIIGGWNYRNAHRHRYSEASGPRENNRRPRPSWYRTFAFAVLLWLDLANERKGWRCSILLQKTINARKSCCFCLAGSKGWAWVSGGRTQSVTRGRDLRDTIELNYLQGGEVRGDIW